MEKDKALFNLNLYNQMRLILKNTDGIQQTSTLLHSLTQRVETENATLNELGTDNKNTL